LHQGQRYREKNLRRTALTSSNESHIELTDEPPDDAYDVILADLVDFNRRLLGDPFLSKRWEPAQS
jgi:hypothetical protein